MGSEGRCAWWPSSQKWGQQISALEIQLSPGAARLHPFLHQDSWARIMLFLPELHSQLEQEFLELK